MSTENLGVTVVTQKLISYRQD